jgi:hypothetical protein
MEAINKERLVPSQRTSPHGTDGPFREGLSALSRNIDKDQDKQKEQGAQDDREPEQRALHTSARGEHTSRIGTGQAAQACALALHDYADYEKNRDYNQRDIQIIFHLVRASF